MQNEISAFYFSLASRVPIKKLESTENRPDYSVLLQRNSYALPKRTFSCHIRGTGLPRAGCVHQHLCVTIRKRSQNACFVTRVEREKPLITDTNSKNKGSIALSHPIPRGKEWRVALWHFLVLHHTFGDYGRSETRPLSLLFFLLVSLVLPDGNDTNNNGRAGRLSLELSPH